jgi:hypothetical protein
LFTYFCVPSRARAAKRFHWLCHFDWFHRSPTRSTSHSSDRFSRFTFFFLFLILSPFNILILWLFCFIFFICSFL